MNDSRIKPPTGQRSEIEITPKMIEAGTLAFSSYDNRFEPTEAAVVRVFYEMMKVGPMAAVGVVLGREVEEFLSPYLTQEGQT